MTDAATRRRRFRRDLAATVNGRARRAPALARDYATLPELASEAPREIRVAPYAGRDRWVTGMAEHLAANAGGDLLGAYVHGSLGSGDAVAYSDFDALVVLSDAAFASPRRLARAARMLNRARRFMVGLDPLQHHGWFVLSEADLRCWPEGYFPSVLFEHSRSLLPGRGERLVAASRTEPGEARSAFDALARSVSEPLEGGWRPAHQYALKALLSRFMLLPTLYVQARDGAGVWKADSFALAAADVDPEAWDAMDRASALRRAWTVDLTAVQRRALRLPSRLGDEVRKRWPVPIPDALAPHLDAELYAGMVRLAHALRRRLDDAPTAAAPARRPLQLS